MRLSDTDRDRIAELARRRGLTLRQIAEDVGCSIATVQRLLPEDARAHYRRPLSTDEKRYVINQLALGRTQGQIARDLDRSPVVVGAYVQFLCEIDDRADTAPEPLVESPLIDLTMTAWEHGQVGLEVVIRTIDYQLHQQHGTPQWSTL